MKGNEQDFNYIFLKHPIFFRAKQKHTACRRSDLNEHTIFSTQTRSANGFIEGYWYFCDQNIWLNQPLGLNENGLVGSSIWKRSELLKVRLKPQYAFYQKREIEGDLIRHLVIDGKGHENAMDLDRKIKENYAYTSIVGNLIPSSLPPQ